MSDFSTVTKNLERLGYTVRCFDTAAEAADELDREIDGVTVGIGGSLTVEQMGLYEKLGSHNRVWWHWRTPEGMTQNEVRDRAALCEVYLSSVNGLAETGEIINIDGHGNRVAATVFGHKKVYLIAGSNKLAPDYDAALWRARNIAAPKNARRLDRKTPCAVNAERCYNCSSPERICRALSVLWEKPTSGDFEIILVGEELGY